MDYYRSLLRPLLFRFPPEMAHGLAIAALKRGMLPRRPVTVPHSLRIRALGLSFAHPIGLAAGFDKNAEAIDGLLAQNFSFVEAGTVTPLPQEGNPRPRLFRLEKDRALINRLGFNNKGLDVFVENLAKARRKGGIVGANIGKNKTQENAIPDYIAGLRAVAPHADYVTVNISSPNTAYLRDLQRKDALNALLSALGDVRSDIAEQSGKYVPLLIKIAPDINAKEREDIAEAMLEHGMEGLVISNTTLARSSSLVSAARNEEGGLSGEPMLMPSTILLADMYRLTQGRLTLIGLGGVASAEDAYAKIRAGASLVQIYTALIYEGFTLVGEIVEGVARLAARDGFTAISQAIGVDAK